MNVDRSATVAEELVGLFIWFEFSSICAAVTLAAVILRGGNSVVSVHDMGAEEAYCLDCHLLLVLGGARGVARFECAAAHR